MFRPLYLYKMKKKHILILNGPNLNLLGRRETNIYGKRSFESFYENLKEQYQNVLLAYYQSNHEGDIIDKLHEVGFNIDGIVLNAGAYTHTSLAIADAVKAIEAPVVEVHISNIYEREEFRHFSYLEAVCPYQVVGKGLDGYREAIEYIQAL